MTTLDEVLTNCRPGPNPDVAVVARHREQLHELISTDPPALVDRGATPRPLELVRQTQRLPRRRRRLVTTVGIGLLAAALGVVMWARQTQPAAVPAIPLDPAVATAPASGPTTFPRIDTPPGGLAVSNRIDTYPAGPLWTEATIGRIVNDTLADAITITVQDQPFDITPAAGRTPRDTVVLGTPATVYDDNANSSTRLTHVTWGTGPYYLASGADPVSVLANAPADFVAPATADADPPTLTFGTLPSGFEVIANPQAVGAPTQVATMSIGSDNFDVSVSARNPITYMALQGPLRRITINGAPAWTFLSATLTQDITWQVNDSTYAYLKTNDGSDLATVTQIATELRFADGSDWATNSEPSTTTAPS